MIILILLSPVVALLLVIAFCALCNIAHREDIKLEQEMEKKERLSREGVDSIEINHGDVEDE